MLCSDPLGNSVDLIKRAFDIVISLLLLVALLPFFLIIAILILIDSKGGIFFRQIRVGKNARHFHILKFRTMFPESEKSGQLTVGVSDKRITPVGRFLRRYKLDEFPQLVNVLRGEMSLVGPRPEVPHYVNLYSQEQKRVLQVRPGITDYASIAFIDENEILSRVDDPERYYVDTIMPEKLRINQEYLSGRTFFTDLKVLGKTIGRIFHK